MADKKTNLFKRGKTYWIRYRNDDGKLIRKSLKTTNKQEAEKEKNRILGKVRGLKTELDFIHAKEKTQEFYRDKNFPISILWQELEKILTRNSSSKDSKNRYKYRINNFVDWLNNNHPEIENLADITDTIAAEYADFLSDTGIANKTYNETLNAIKRAIDFFMEKAGLKTNPFRKDNIQRKDITSFSRKEFSEAETMQILNSFDDIDVLYKKELEVLFYLGTFAGLRMKDAALIKWDSIDFDTNYIYIEPAKTKKYKTAVKIPIHPDLKQKLYNALNWKKNNYVLPTLANRYNRNRNNIRKYVLSVLEQNGFKTTINKKDTEETRKHSACQYGFHSLRYTFVSVCAKNGIPATLVQDIVGHKSPAMTKHYTRFDDDFTQKQIKKFSVKELPQQNQSEIQEIIQRLQTADKQTITKILNLLKNNNDLYNEG